ncbi:MAG: hypothetical protein ACE5JH_01670 [Acidobacteriota bacterium]
MSLPRTIGFPRMMKERGERRAFLPEFVRRLARRGVTAHLEAGCGSRSGYSLDDYRRAGAAVRECSREEAFGQDLVLVLRSPEPRELSLLRRGGCLISMLHFPTRPRRVALLRELGLRAISLDGIENDSSERLVENMRAVAWNGLEAAFDVLERRCPGLMKPDGGPIRVLVLGSGMVGKDAVDAATKLGSVERNNRHIEGGGPGVIVLTAGRNRTVHAATMERLMRRTDVLVDASQRYDPSVPVIPNAWLGWLPEHAVVADLAVDPYTLDTDPPVVRGLEGIPQGNLDKYLFAPDDPDWDATVPPSIPSGHRRTVVSCYSWPGIHPEACMRRYGRQLEPMIEVLLRRGYDGLSPDGDHFERALHRGGLRFWLQRGRESRRA